MMSPKSRKRDQKIKTNGRRFSVFPDFVCGNSVSLVSRLGQSGPSMFSKK